MTIANVQGITKASKTLAVKASKGDGDFMASLSNMMAKTSDTQSYSSKSTNVSDVAGTKDQTNAAQQKDRADQSQDTRSTNTPKSVSTTKKDRGTVEAKDSQDVAPMDQGSDVVVSNEVVEQVVNEVKQLIADALSVTPDELSSMMEQCGLTDADLFDANSVIKLIMQQNAYETPAQILTNEDLTSTVKDLMEQISASKAELIPEELTQVQKVLAQTEVTAQISDSQSDEAVAPVTADAEEVQQIQNVKVTVSSQTEEHDAAGQQSGTKDSFAFTSGKETTPAEPVMTNGQVVYDQVAQAVSNAQGLSSAGNTTAVDIINQIVDEIKATVKADTQSMQMQLNPEHLGKVSVQIVAREGVITAQIHAQSELARQAIESQLGVLKENFQNQGLKVESVEVAVGLNNFNMEQQQQFEEQQKQSSSKTRRTLRMEDLELADDLSEEETIAAEMMRQSGSQIDFSA